MNQLEWKVKVAALWILVIFSLLIGLVLIAIMASAGMVATEGITGQNLPFVAMIFFLEAIIVWLTLALKPRISRWPNIVLAAICLLSK
jgi:hypothetical protein